MGERSLGERVGWRVVWHLKKCKWGLIFIALSVFFTNAKLYDPLVFQYGVNNFFLF